VTSRDNFVIDFDRNAIENRIKEYVDENISNETIRSKYGLRDKKNWKLADSREELRRKDWRSRITRVLYRPFDVRWILYDESVIERPRTEVMKHMIEKNLSLCIGRQWDVVGSKEYDVVFLSENMIDLNLFRRGGAVIFPLYLYTDSDKKPNFNEKFLEFVQEKYGDVSPEEIFYYIYAVLYSPTYRKRYEEFLRYDFPRIPFVDDFEKFKKLAELGKELVELHLMKRQLVPKVKFDIQGSNVVENVKYKNGKVWINKTQYFDGIPEDIWNFYIGGYKVLEKWLKSRKGRKLSGEDIMHFLQIVEIIRETIRIMNEIDEIKIV